MLLAIARARQPPCQHLSCLPCRARAAHATRGRQQPQPSPCGPRLRHRLLTLCRVSSTNVWLRGTGSVGDGVGEGHLARKLEAADGQNTGGTHTRNPAPTGAEEKACGMPHVPRRLEAERRALRLPPALASLFKTIASSSSFMNPSLPRQQPRTPSHTLSPHLLILSLHTFSYSLSTPSHTLSPHLLILSLHTFSYSLSHPAIGAIGPVAAAQDRPVVEGLRHHLPPPHVPVRRAQWVRQCVCL